MQTEDLFAYESFRPNQKELALCAYDNCIDGRTLLTEAMSGFGKTAAVLCGAISAARERGCKVLYACRTKRQILRVVEEISLLQKKRRLAASAMFSKADCCLLKRTSSKSIPQEQLFSLTQDHAFSECYPGRSALVSLHPLCLGIPR